MSATVSFTDAVGAAVLTGSTPAPGNRFGAWVPRKVPIGDTAVTLATGASSMFVFRTDYGAAFEVRKISSKASGSVAPVDLAVRLIAHLIQGGTCSIATGDAASSTYATCGIWPGSTPTLTLADPKLMEYTLALEVLNLAGSPGLMVCRYTPNP